MRCIMMVHNELKALGLKYVSLDLGVAETFDDLTLDQRDRLKHNLAKSGLELMDDKKAILIEKIKNAIVQLIHHSDDLPSISFSEYLSNLLDYDYTYLSNMFSEVKGITIQQFIIINKIERVKELILYNELNLTEIAFKLNYSSVAHMSNQFKKITGLSPSYYKSLKSKRSLNLEDM